MNASRLIAILLVLIALVWVGSGYLAGDNTDEGTGTETTQNGNTGTSGNTGNKGKEQPRASVRTITSKAVDHVEYLRVSGRTEAAISVDIRAQIEARVEEIGAAKGQRVKKGDLLVKLAIDDRMARVQKARALVDQRNLEYKAAQSLAAKNFRSKTGVAESLALLEEARADLKLAEIELEHTEIRAPFDGILETRPAEIGDLLSIGDPVATLIQADPMLVVAQVPEHSIAAIETGQLAKVTLFDGQSHDGVVRYTARVADNATRTFRVEIEIANPDLAIPDGMTAELEIPVGTHKAHRVAPSVLTLNDAGELGVRAIVDDNKVAFFPVTLQGGNREGVWIGDLPDTLELIFVGHDWVKEGAIVNVEHVDTDENGMPVTRTPTRNDAAPTPPATQAETVAR